MAGLLGFQRRQFHYLVHYGQYYEQMISRPQTNGEKTRSIGFSSLQTTATSRPIHVCHKVYYAMGWNYRRFQLFKSLAG